MLVLLAKKCVYEYEDALDYILNGKKVVDIVEDEEGYWVGRYLDNSNYDKIVADFWSKKRDLCRWPMMMCDVMVFDNKSKVAIPEGKYEVMMIERMVGK